MIKVWFLVWLGGAENSQDGSEWISLLLVSITVHDKVDDDDDALGLVVVWAIWPLALRIEYYGYRSKQLA